jgi:DNA-binding beta-propeller fold protein YncE
MKTIFLLIAGMAIGAISIGQVNYHVSTVLPEGSNQFDDGLTMDENGTIYASYWGEWQGTPGTHVYRIRKNGHMDTLAVGFNRPNGIHYSEGKVYVANSRGHNVSRVDTLTGQVEVLISVINPSNVMKFPGVDSLLIVSYSGRKLYGYSDWYGLNEISSSSKLTGPVGIALSDAGDVYIGNFDDGKILKLNDQHEFDEIADVGGGTGFFAIHGDSLYATNHVTKRVQVVN